MVSFRHAAALNLVLLLGLLSACAQQQAESGNLPPNIILILVDDLGIEGIGCYGGTTVPTPRIDQLAAEGALFTDAHTTPLCTPTRVRLMTGRGGLRSYVDFATLSPEESTFATQLKSAGYATGITGKWQLGGRSLSEETGQANGSTPVQAGFDTWCLWQVDQRGPRYFDPKLNIDGETHKLNGDYGPDVFKDWAKEFMGRDQGTPFFLYYPMALPHDPFVGTPNSAKAPEGEPEGKQAQRHFQDMVAHMDLIVGELLDHADSLGIADNTIVIFTTDNSHSGRVWLQTGTTRIFGSKKAPIESGTHVPLIVRWPNHVEAGSRIDDLVDLMDLMPTVVEVGGAELPDGVPIDGISLVQRLQTGQPLERQALAFWYDPRPHGDESDPVRWARSKDFKLYDDGRLARITDHEPERTYTSPATDSPEAREQRLMLEQALGRLPKAPERFTIQ